MSANFFGQRPIKRNRNREAELTSEQIAEAIRIFQKAGGKIEKIKVVQQPDESKRRAFSNFDGDFGSILEEEERWEQF